MNDEQWIVMSSKQAANQSLGRIQMMTMMCCIQTTNERGVFIPYVISSFAKSKTHNA